MVFFINDRKTDTKHYGPYATVTGARRVMTSRALAASEFFISDENWREREAARDNLIDLEHFGLTPITDHFLHVSVKQEEDGSLMVSFTANEQKGRADRQESGRRIGRYLKEFYPHLNDDSITYFSGQLTAKYREAEVHFAVTAEEIRDVYRKAHNTCGSCMTHPLSGYSSENQRSKIHPVEAYEGPDLQLAYTKDKQGNITARALVWPDKKKHGRVYAGDTDKFESQLAALGYSFGELYGARISAKHLKDDDGYSYYAMPYIDYNSQYVTFVGDHFLIGSHSDKGKVVSSSTGGYVYFQVYRCALTGKILSESKAYSVRNGRGNSQVYIDYDLRHTDEFRAAVANFDGSEYWMNGPEADYLRAADGTKFPRYCSGRSMRQCLHDGLYYRQTDMTNGIYIKNFIKHYARCEMTGEAIDRRRARWMEHGAWWSRDAFMKWGRSEDGKNYSIIHTLEPAAEAA